jgi:hypothetical protein
VEGALSRTVATLVYSRKTGSLTRKAVLAYCADRASDDGRGVWASKQSIADEIECDRRTVIRTMNALIAEKILIPVGTRSCQGGATVEYNINIEAIEKLPLVREKRSSGVASPVTESHQCQSVTPGSDTVSPKPSLEPTTPVSSDEETAPPALNGKPKASIPQLQEAWNSIAVPSGAVECRRMGPERQRKAGPFLKRYPIEDITEAIHAVAQSDFLCGRGRDNFRADIEFLFSPKHMNRLLEGFYAG